MIGASQEQVTDPIKAYGSIEVEDYESKLLELLGDMSDYAEENIQDDEEDFTAASDNPLSIPSLCTNFGIEISTINQSHSSGRWKYLGSTQIRCIDCGSKPQLFFGQIEIRDSYAIVCTRCEVIRDDQEYESDTVSDILVELEISK
jgi:hypothetical protein